MTQRTTDQMVDWYRIHETSSEVGFDVDSMCQKICRTARNIGSGFASAHAQMVGTPEEDRVHKIADMTKGMILLIADFSDDNPFDHVATIMGRFKGVDHDDPSSLITRTNSVVSDRIVVVSGGFYGPNWGDEIQFASTSINGVDLDLPGVKPGPKPPKPLTRHLGKRGIRRLEAIVENYDEMIDLHKGRPGEHPRIVEALRRDRREVRQTIRLLEEKKKGK